MSADPLSDERVIQEYGAIEGGRQTLERLGEQLAAAPVIV
jgi:hypothetical protein